TFNNTATGTINKADTGNIYIRPTGFTNAGLIDVKAGTLIIVPSLTNTGVIFSDTGAVFEISGAVFTNATGGTISGMGTIRTPASGLINEGTIFPGVSPGILTIDGDFTQDATGILNIEIGGINPGTDYDQLVITGTATLAGTLNVTLIPSFVPTSGTFDIITYASKTGAFSSIILPSATTWGVDAGATSFVLTAGVGNDTDSDGMDDDWEYATFGDLSSDGTADTDNDGLSDLEEFTNNTDPHNPDSDGDGFVDGAEVRAGSDPNSNTDYPSSMIIVVDFEIGDDSNHGQTWSSPKVTIQAALDACSTAGGGEVWVKAGTYNESITLKSGVDLYGGFAGTETSLDQRDWITNVTTIDGQSSVYHVVIGENNAHVEGFVITGGYADGGSGNDSSGAGILNDGKSPSFQNCLITNNFALSHGVAVYNNNSSPKFINCIFTSNTTTAFVWGIGMVNINSSPIITNCTFSGNSGPSGNETATITNIQVSSPIITNTILWGNSPSEYSNGFGTGSPLITYSNIQGGLSGTGNINIDPLFVVGDPSFHLQSASPCIDTGNNSASNIPTEDIDGDLRISNGTVDMGADESVLSLAMQRASLIDLYNSTNGDSWAGNSGWKDPPLDTDGFAMPGTECTWFGVACDGSNNITDINLGYNNITGTIPASIGDLTELQSLTISGNQLTGTIPPELGNLSNLTALWLDSNQLTGTIPPELGNLANLTVLWLDSNQLTGTIPPELGNLSSLAVLELDSNQLTGTIPPELGNLTNLQYLRLDSNQLTGSIPPELGNLVNLLYLYLLNNQLTGSIPSELGLLTNLQRLNLPTNQLSGPIPPELGNLANLQHLSLNGNQLTGSIPGELGNLINLQYLYLNNNQLTGLIPTELDNISNLLDLSLHTNQLSGTIPTEFGNLLNLQYISLNSNQLSGSIPTELANLTNLLDDTSDFRWNALYTSDGTLLTFLNSKQSGGDWESYQTIAPTDLAAGTPTDTTVPLTWSAIAYWLDTGGYEIYYATTSGGPYTLLGITDGKEETGLTVTGLNPGTTYYFRLR
ncbi:leucine-rich repeat domain-containing protein, partial [Thermodesulfobacteriota bacterium]